MAEFADIREKRNLTCPAAPTQYEGQLEDGRYYFFHYRYGRASLGLGTSVQEAIHDPHKVRRTYGDSLDGHMTEARFEEIAAELLSLHE